jgi:hypothetical protein
LNSPPPATAAGLGLRDVAERAWVRVLQGALLRERTDAALRQSRWRIEQSRRPWPLRRSIRLVYDARMARGAAGAPPTIVRRVRT